MLHCLRALVLLGVPMPWDQAYLAKQRWWHCSFDACYIAGLCCFSSRLPEVGEVTQGEAGTVRIGEQGMGECARAVPGVDYAPCLRPACLGRL